MKKSIITMAIVALTLSACAGVSFTAEPSVKIDHTSFNYGDYSSRAVKVDVIDNNVTPTFYVASERELGDSTPKENFVLAPGLDIFDEADVTAWVVAYTGIPDVDAVINCDPDNEKRDAGDDGLLNTPDDVVTKGPDNCSWF
jgi:spermidine/putrescine-binding protein